MMVYNEFLTNFLGKAIDFDNAYGVQCVDLIKLYLTNCFDINMKGKAFGDAHCYYDDFKKHKELTDNFNIIKNTASFIPEKGDICVFSKKMNNTGHICIAAGIGTKSFFYSYDQNWNSKEMKMCLHNYKYFLGVLRPKEQDKVLGIRHTKTNLNAYENTSYKKAAIVIPKDSKVEILDKDIKVDMTKGKTTYQMSRIEYKKKVYYVARKYLKY